MSFLRGDATDIYRLAGDLTAVPARAVLPMRAGMAAAGEAFAQEWAANARETSGEHGRYYPDSIDSELVFDARGISVDAGPSASKKQGGMGKGFEFGSVNQPPHLDGLRAMDGMQMRVERMIDAAIGHVL